MTIYEIEQAMLDCIDFETGEVDAERLEQLEMERDAKIENVGCWVKNLKAEAEAIRSEEKALAERRRVMENRIESLKNYMAYALRGEKFSSPRVAVSFRRSKAVDVYDEAQLTDEFITYTPKVNKTAIKEAINSGHAVSGARIVENTSIQIK